MKEKRGRYQFTQDFVRVATATPEVAVADIATNTSRITTLYTQAIDAQAALVVFPELSITGYSIQDLVLSPHLLNDAKESLISLSTLTKNTSTALIVGLPFTVHNALYNCAALLADGEIKGIVPKQHLPTYNEFYEKRWYHAWEGENTTVTVNGSPVTFGVQQVFSIAGQLVGIEICEDLWVPEQPSTYLATHGATIIANPSASPDTVTKARYRKDLVAHTAARNVLAYIYVSADSSESTSDIVMGGHALINELGTTLAERKPFTHGQQLLVADIDTQHIARDRMKDSNFPHYRGITITNTTIAPVQGSLKRTIDPAPFVPKGTPSDAAERFEEILTIQATGLAMRLEKTGIQKVILGLSGGLDSTLALLVGVCAATLLDKKPGDLLYTLTMPGVASSHRTQNNAVKLAEALGIPNDEVPIKTLSDEQLAAIHHDGAQDITFENTQARIRQALVFNKANQLGGLALGTGDLSEIALGWCTYNGDHMSHYNVNASIPKTLVRSLVQHASSTLPKKARTILADILDTPVSPELTGDGTTITQATEDLVGPYELHDFFLYHFLRWMEPQEKIYTLAVEAFAGRYTEKEVRTWLTVFFERFYKNQWKRQAMPDGAKVGISLSPRGDWRMPPEAVLS